MEYKCTIKDGQLERVTLDPQSSTSGCVEREDRAVPGLAVGTSWEWPPSLSHRTPVASEVGAGS